MATRAKSLVAVAGLTAAALLYTVIPQQEGRPKTGYLDPLGIPTKCFGDTQDVEVGRAYSDAECRASLERALLDHCEPVIASAPDLRQRPYALAAACSLTYNIGAGAWKRSDALKHARLGDIAGMCRAIMVDDAGRRVYITGRDRRTGQRVYLKGLDDRRQLERMICETEFGGPRSWQASPAAQSSFRHLMRDYQSELVRLRPDFDINDVE